MLNVPLHITTNLNYCRLSNIFGEIQFNRTNPLQETGNTETKFPDYANPFILSLSLLFSHALSLSFALIPVNVSASLLFHAFYLLLFSITNQNVKKFHACNAYTFLNVLHSRSTAILHSIVAGCKVAQCLFN